MSVNTELFEAVAALFRTVEGCDYARECQECGVGRTPEWERLWEAYEAKRADLGIARELLRGKHA